MKAQRFICRLAICTFVSVGFASDARAQGSGNVFSETNRAIGGRACPVITDPAGNNAPGSVDLTKVYAANDSHNLYFLLEFANDFSSNNTLSALHLDTDLNQMTGCQIPGNNQFLGAEAAVFFQGNLGGFLGNTGDSVDGCSAGSDDFPPGTVRTASRGRFLAVAVSLEALRSLTPDMQGLFLRFEGGGQSDLGISMLR